MIHWILDATVYLALAVAAWAAFRGGPAAGALVMSNIGCRIASLLGFGFDVRVWFAVDLVVIACITLAAFRRGKMLHREVAIIGLFPVIWRFYWLPERFAPSAELQHVVVTLLVVAQLIFSLPWRTVVYRAARKAGVRTEVDEPHYLEARHAG